MPLKRRRLIAAALSSAALLALLVLVAGKSLPGPEDPGADARRAAGDPAAVAALADSAPAPQAVILQDGEVTDVEYEQALRAERACVADAGYRPDELTWSDGQLGFTTTADFAGEPDPEAADEAFLASTDQCRRQHTAVVASVWVAER